MGIGRVQEGITSQKHVRINESLPQEGEIIVMKRFVIWLFRYRGIRKVEVDSVSAGDIVAIAGLKAVESGDTVTTKVPAEKLEPVPMDEPTISMEFFDQYFSLLQGKKGSMLRQLK